MVAGTGKQRWELNVEGAMKKLVVNSITKSQKVLGGLTKMDEFIYVKNAMIFGIRYYQNLSFSLYQKKRKKSVDNMLRECVVGGLIVIKINEEILGDNFKKWMEKDDR